METTPTPEQKMQQEVDLLRAHARLCQNSANTTSDKHVRKVMLAEARKAAGMADVQALFLAGRKMLLENQNAPEAA